MSGNGNVPVTEADLHAFADGLLSEGRRAEIESYLATRADEAERVRAWRRQAEGLHALYDGVLSEPIPAALALGPPAPSRLPGRLAAAAALLLVGGGVGWAAHSLLRPPAQARARSFDSSQELAHQAAVAHAVFSPEVRHPVEVGVDQEAHLVGWLSKRLGAELRPPRLGALGFELMGGRLLAGSRGPVAQFMYKDAAGQRLTLYVASEPGAGADTAFRFSRDGSVGVFSWIDGGFGYGLSGALGREELLRVAEAVYAQLQH
jgi:anti-sigma factor RsiW